MLDKKQVQIYFQKFLRLFIDKKSFLFLVETWVLPFIVLSVFSSDVVFYEYSATKTASLSIVLAGIWIGLFNSITSICSERKVIKFEHRMKGLSLPSYMFARVLSDFCLCFIESVSMTVALTVFYARLKENSGQTFLIFLTLFLVIFTSDMLGLLVSALVKKTAQATAVLPMVVIVQIILSNFIADLDSKALPVRLFSYGTISKWGTTAFFRIANQHNLIPHRGSVDWSMYQADGANTFVFDMFSIVGNWSILVVFAGVFVSLATLLLKTVSNDSR